MYKQSVLMTIPFLILALASQAIEPVGWRTDGTGEYPSAEAVIHWASGENVVWKTPMPSQGNAMPVIAGDRVFVCSEPDQLICANHNTGEILWRSSNPPEDSLSAEQKQRLEGQRDEMKALQEKEEQLGQQIGQLDKEKKELISIQKGEMENTENLSEDRMAERIEEIDSKLPPLREQLEAVKAELERRFGVFILAPKHDVNGYTSATPVCDGEHIWTVFGTGVVACHDMEGNRKWIRYVEKPEHVWGHSSSPLLAEGKLLVHLNDFKALDPETGEEIWSTPAEYTFGTPVLWTAWNSENQPLVYAITPKGDVLRVSDGKKMVSKLFYMPYGSPIVEGDVLYSVDEQGGVAYRLPQTVKDDFEAVKLWNNEPKKDRYYASPVVYDGLLYVINQRSFFSAIDIATGDIVYEERINFGKGTTYPSICLVDNYLIVSHDNGKTVVLAPGREYKEFAQNELEEFRSTPVFKGAKMYLRTLGGLYCID